MNLDFTIPARIVFGPGRLAEAGALAEPLGRRAFVVTGHTGHGAAPLVDSLNAHELECTTFAAIGEPELHTVREAVAALKRAECDLVVAIGGGAALDTAKAAAVLATNSGDVLDYLEIIGAGRPLVRPSLPFIAIPTTAGSGAEATWNSVIVSREHRAKVSLRHRMMAARVALVDPELTYSLTPTLTASTGMDALAQSIEAFVSAKASPFTDGMCLEGVRRATRSLRRAATGPHDPQAREDMAMASLLGGVVLANAGLGAAHGIAGPLGGMLGAPHGALCAALLPAVVTQNVRSLRARRPESEALSRYETLAAILTGGERPPAEEGAAWLRSLVSDLSIPTLGELGLRQEDVSELVDKAMRASSMRGNPILLDNEEVTHIIESSL